MTVELHSMMVSAAKDSWKVHLGTRGHSELYEMEICIEALMEQVCSWISCWSNTTFKDIPLIYTAIKHYPLVNWKRDKNPLWI